MVRGFGDGGNGGRSSPSNSEFWCSGDNWYSKSESSDDVSSGTTVSLSVAAEEVAGVCNLADLRGASLSVTIIGRVYEIPL